MEPNNNEDHDMKTVYIYSTLSILAVSLVSLLGAAVSEQLMSCFGHRELWLQGFFALTVAVLSADSLLHLIPRAINGYPEDHSSNSTTPAVPSMLQSNQEYLVRMVLLFAIVYLLYMFELITTSLKGITRAGHTVTAVHSANHTRPPREENCRQENSRQSFRMRKRSQMRNGSISICSEVQVVPPAHALIHKESEAALESPTNGHMATVGSKESICIRRGSIMESVASVYHTVQQNTMLRCLTYFDPIVAIIFLGDAVHNFADGLEIGVSFTRSTWTGFSASLVVVCHEMPHEIGDYIDLRESGLTMSQALAVNAVSSFAAIIGLYVGLSIGHLQNARPWMFAITAGMFLYLAWVHILPHLKSIDISQRVLQGVVIQTLGFVSGYGVIFILVWYEKDLQL